MDYEARRKTVLKAARSLMAANGREFTTVALCKKTRLSKSQMRRVFANKAELLSVLDKENEQTPSVQSADAKDITEYDEAADRRFRVLQRAVTLLEARIDALGAEHSSNELSREAAGIERALAATSQSFELAPPTTEPDETQQRDQVEDGNINDLAGLGDAPANIPPIAIQEPVLNSQPTVVAVTREILDNARALAQIAGEKNARVEASERKRNLLTLISIAAIVMVGLVVGVASMGGAARATRAPIATPSETLARVSGVTTINATGAIVDDQMNDATQALKERAEKGEADAQAELALAYLRGDGVVSNTTTASGWAGLAASKGQPLAQFLLATLFNSGIKPDPRSGFRWMSAAALNGNIKAMHNVAVALINGSGVERNPVEAANWFNKAASLGYRDSAFDLAVLYERGEGVTQNTRQALYWYDKAAAAGDKESAQRARLLRFGVPPISQ